LKIKLGKQQLSSYHYQEIKGSGGETIGTVHIAHMTNNYFSESIVANITCFIREAGVIIHNAMLYKQVTTMERDIRNVFSKFVPPEIINDLVTRKTSATLLGGEKRFVSILFVDIRSFTTMSEENPPEAVVRFLNRYLETMGEIIQDHGGTVDKYIGDAVLAVFGAPKSWPDNAARAIRTAIAMSKALRNFPTESIILPPEGFDIGIGIHCGDAIVGNIGSSSKQDYTVIGDTVNLASRLEGLTRVYRSRIIISNEVAKEVEPSSEYSFREVEEVIVKGKGKPTLIHVVEDESTLLLTGSARENYLKGLSMYRLRNWKTAAEYFQKVLAEELDDPLSRIFLERCLSFIDKAPPTDWDMVQRYITK
jgi:class 3 adenylate cyclase